MPQDVVEQLAKSAQKRMVAKGGKVNVTMKNLPEFKRLFFKDFFTTALDLQWRYVRYKWRDISFYVIGLILDKKTDT